MALESQQNPSAPNSCAPGVDYIPLQMNKYVYIQFNYKIMEDSMMFSPRDMHGRFVCGSFSENCKVLKTFAWKMRTEFGSIYTYKQTLWAKDLPKKQTLIPVFG